MLDPQHVITAADELRRVVPPPRPAQETKVLSALDVHCRRWIQRSPFVVVSSIDSAGRMDLSPKGDPPGFVQILDDETLVIPDRPGNRRLDTLHNLLERPQVGLMFVVPGRGEVLRVSGTGQIVTDPDLLATMAVATGATAGAVTKKKKKNRQSKARRGKSHNERRRDAAR